MRRVRDCEESSEQSLKPEKEERKKEEDLTVESSLPFTPPLLFSTGDDISVSVLNIISSSAGVLLSAAANRVSLQLPSYVPDRNAIISHHLFHRETCHSIIRFYVYTAPNRSLKQVVLFKFHL
uniref:Uncharacterized protein n=1 Tax=Knipowitschia caucasica TaxID=637954 RepID=A0AAV2MBS7_KNICA